MAKIVYIVSQEPIVCEGAPVLRVRHAYPIGRRPIARPLSFAQVSHLETFKAKLFFK
jgi:hypothetical protein